MYLGFDYVAYKEEIQFATASTNNEALKQMFTQTY